MKAKSERLAIHEYFMQRAYHLACRGWYTTRPNPRVGCLIVRRQRILGEGWHMRAGEDHAERRALADAVANGHKVRGATAYVTLEPCNHTGRTAPCTEALIDAGVERVFIGTGDPNPEVNGQGVARLREAGVEVHTGIAHEVCDRLNPGFGLRMRTGRPRVRVKLAMSLDGRSAAPNGQSQWITGREARTDGHRLRAESGAVMVGRGTCEADDPSLNVRLEGDWLQPMRVVLDTGLAMSPESRMLSLPGQTVVFTASDDNAQTRALERSGATVRRVEKNGRSVVDLHAVMKSLGDMEINDVLVEAGPVLAGALAEAGLADEYIVYLAPRFIGDAGRGVLQLSGVNDLADTPDLHVEAIDSVGDDWRIIARPAVKKES